MKKLVYHLLFIILTYNFCSYSNMVDNRDLEGVNANYSTHMTALVTTVMNTDGPVLELGCGDFSTPLLHAICSAQKRLLLSVESDEQWMKLFYDLKRDWHHFLYVANKEEWKEVGEGLHWNVVFVDHWPGPRRVVDMERLRPNIDIFVVHDTNLKHHGYEPYISTFKYRYDYKRYKQRTTVLSDTVDVAKFFVD